MVWLILSGVVLACSSAADEEAGPACPNNFSAVLIEQLSQRPKQNPAAEITQYNFQGQTVYLVTGGGSSSLNYLFDMCGTVLCAASGGPNSGQGDGRCPDFQVTATNPVLIWRDPR